MRMTIRKAIKQMKKVNTHIIHCKNGAKIYLTSMQDDEQSMSSFKTIDGERVCRYIYCHISENEGVKKIPEIEKHCLKRESDGYVWDEDNYILPEKVMNLLLNVNEGIDEYKTISCPGFMMFDALSM